MKKYTLLLMLVVYVSSFELLGQNFVDLTEGKNTTINGILVGYSAVKKETKKGSDLYRITVTITNQGADYLRLFETAPDYFEENTANTLAYFQFTNANGKALSATSARFYPSPKYISVSYSCKKCTPVAKDEDPDNHYTKSVLIGLQFPSGTTKSESYSIRVPEGEDPKVRVMVY